MVWYEAATATGAGVARRVGKRKKDGASRLLVLNEMSVSGKSR
jgi:hypothetical protein